MPQVKFVPLVGSVRSAPRGTRAFTKKDDEEVIDITLRLRPKRSAVSLDKLVAKLGRQPPRSRSYLTREQLEDAHGASPDDLIKVGNFAHAHGLTVATVHLSSRVVHLRGSLADMRAAFKVDLRKFVAGGRTYRVREGAVSIPATLKGIVLGVHGLDNRPVASPHFRMRRASAAGAARPLTVAEVAAAYNFPGGLDGTGQCIAIIELNGIDDKGRAIDTGYKASDLETFFKRNKLPLPEVTAIGVDGGANLPGKHDGGDDEVVLDIEVAGAVAPGAKIAVYFAPNTSSGFINAIKAAVYDKVRKPSVISISWGGPEDPNGDVASSYMDALNEAIRDAAAVGVTVCVSSGDDGASDMATHWDGKPHVDFPASSPFALACGGTRLSLSNGAVQAEVVWNNGAYGGGGGGVSNYFARPDYQANASVALSPKKKKGRGVPDVAGNADPQTGYRIFLKGKPAVIGGTSAVSPLMAGLLACINQRLAKTSKGSAGFVNPLLYPAGASKVFRDIVTGNNDTQGGLAGKYAAGPGWDGCSGLGVVDGAKLLKLLAG